MPGEPEKKPYASWCTKCQQIGKAENCIVCYIDTLPIASHPVTKPKGFKPKRRKKS